MSTHAGLWIDHKNAVIVIVSDSEETMQHVESSVEKHVRFSGGSRPGGSRDGGGEATRERRFDEQLNHYYDKVIGTIRDAKGILIFGPGEAGGQLRKRLEDARLGDRVLGVEPADKMTEPQIAAKVRDYFAQ